MSVINNLYTNTASSETVEYNNNISGLASHDIKSAIDELASLNRMYSYDFTLDNSVWSGSSAPFLYRINSDKITAGCNIILALSESATIEHIEEAAICAIDVAEYGEGYVLLSANANKPLINLPITISVGKLISVADGRNADYITFENVSGEDWVTANTINAAMNQILTRISNVIKSSSAKSIEVDDTRLNTGKTNVQDVLEYITANGVSGGSRRHTDIILYYSNWVGTGPYMYTINRDNITSNSDVGINASFYMTTDQYQSLTNASIVCGGTFDDGRIILKAFGEKPSIDLPVVLVEYN